MEFGNGLIQAGGKEAGKKAIPALLTPEKIASSLFPVGCFHEPAGFKDSQPGG